MQFLFQPLTWGFLLVLLPVLIHLINMMRHQRVRWAAMDFLLKSYKKHRRWVWLKQLLLLLSRMAAVALLVAMLAQWLPRGNWFDRLGGRTTHHLVLLDDSLSMTEQADDLSAFEAGWRVIAQLGKLASEDRSSQHHFTLLRFSHAARGGEADLNDEVVDSEFDVLLQDLHQKLEPSLLAVGPAPALDTASRLVRNLPDYSHRVYLVTDLRKKDWESPAEVKQSLEELRQAGAELQIVGCGRGNNDNLAVVGVEPDSGARAAGIPLFVNLRVKNFGTVAAKRVQLKAVVATYPDAATAQPGKLKPAEQEETIEIEQIGPGETVTARVQAFFASAGQHVVRAELPEDATPADNVRTAIIDIQAAEQLLIIDGDPNSRNAFFLDAIFRPGGRAETGVTPVTQGVEYLRTAAEDVLRQYAAVFLCDVATLDQRAIDNLEAYARGGGGVAFFVGEQVSLDFYRERLYRGGEGLFPAPLARDAMLLPPGSPDTPNVDVLEERHPVFRELLLGRNPVIRLVKVDRYLQPADDWNAKADPEVKVVAQLYNGDPLFLEKRFGRGRVAAVLSTYAPLWNDMVLGPNVLVTLKLQAYLAETRGQREERLVGQPLNAQLNAQKELAQVTFVAPGRQADAPRTIEREAAQEPNSPIMVASLIDPQSPAGETDRPGVYEAWVEEIGGGTDVRRHAYNVDIAESDLAATTPQELATVLDPTPFEYLSADDMGVRLAGAEGFNPSLWLMGLLLLVLAGEQILAYANTYHSAPSARGGAA